MQSLSVAMMKRIQAQGNNQEYQKTVERVFSDPQIQAFLNQHQAELTPESVQRDYSKLYEFFHENQLILQNQTSIAPGYQPKLLINAGQIDVAYVPSAQLRAEQRAKELRDRVTIISMPKWLPAANFDDFYTDDQQGSSSRNLALEEALKFCMNYSVDHFQPGLYLSGSFGVGKTYLLGATANELAKRNVKTTILHFPSFVVKMRQAIQNRTLNEERDQVSQAPVLMIDDIGADVMTSWARDDLLAVILEYRMQAELPTFFSSNMTMNELENHLAEDNKDNVEPLKAKRIMQRIQYLSREIDVQGNNLRMS